MISLISHPYGPYRLGDFLIGNLCDAKWTDFRASVAFVKRSGTEYIQSELSNFALSKRVCMSVGIDHGGSSVEGLTHLLNAVAGRGGLWVYKNSTHTFHPKVFLFKNKSEADLLVGSGNLTKGGLFENVEIGVRIKLDLGKVDDAQFLAELEAILDRYSQARAGICLPLDSSLIDTLKAAGELPTEQEAADAMKAAKKSLTSGGATKGPSPFSSEAVPKAPAAKTAATSPTPAPAAAPAGAAAAVPPVVVAPPAGAAAPAAALAIGVGPTFGITLQTTDVSVGKRSPELFVPVGAIDANPAFWGWNSTAQPDMTKYTVDAAWALDATNAANIAKIPASSQRPRDKLDWKVNVSLQGVAGLVSTTFWFNPVKRDLRMRAKILRGAGSVGDILLISQAPPGALHDYDMRVIPKASPLFNAYYAQLTTKVKKPSKKEFGYI